MISYYDLSHTALILPAVVLLCALAVAAGVGGGALYMPLYVWLTGDAHTAVPLSKITTNGVAWSAFLFNVRSRHPDKDQPLIDYNTALILEPLTLIGTIVGVIANILMTNGQVLTVLISVTTVTALKTFNNGWRKKLKEDHELGLKDIGGRSENKAAGEDSKQPSVELVSRVRYSGDDDADVSDRLVPLNEEDERRAVVIRAYEARQYPWEKILLILFCMAIHSTSIFLIGGPRDVICGDNNEYLLLAGSVACQVIVTLLWRSRLLSRQKEKDRLGLSTTDFRYCSWSTLLYPFASFVAGVCAGGLGIAGGLIKGPLMINWGLVPQASTATAIFMILFTSSSTVLQYVLLGRLNCTSSLIFWMTGFVGGYSGSFVLTMLIERYSRQSYVAIFLAIIIVASGMCMSGVVLAEMFEFIPHVETNVTWAQFCTIDLREPVH